MQRLVEVQALLKAPKSQYNNFGKYSYRSCEDILEGIKPLLAERNLFIVISDDIATIGDRFYVRATVTLYDSEGKVIAQNHGFAREEDVKKGMDGSQVTGAASSYARKYALNGMFAIDDTKDSDATNDGKSDEKPKTKPTKAVAPELKTIIDDITAIFKTKMESIGRDKLYEIIEAEGSPKNFTNIKDVALANKVLNKLKTI